jgi:hypothetical protein
MKRFLALPISYIDLGALAPSTWRSSVAYFLTAFFAKKEVQCILLFKQHRGYEWMDEGASQKRSKMETQYVCMNGFSFLLFLYGWVAEHGFPLFLSFSGLTEKRRVPVFLA